VHASKLLTEIASGGLKNHALSPKLISCSIMPVAASNRLGHTHPQKLSPAERK
jgi:hypothetical protein